MRLTRMHCDGCARQPSFWEWAKGELSASGYENWRHPGIAFKEAGCPLVYDKRKQGERLFLQLFGRPMPEELSYLCPECQMKVEIELPALVAADPGDPEPTFQQGEPPGHYFGR